MEYRVIVQVPFAEGGDISGREAGGEFLRHFPLPYDIAGRGEDKREAVAAFFGQADAFFRQKREAVVFHGLLDDFFRDTAHAA